MPFVNILKKSSKTIIAVCGKFGLFFVLFLLIFFSFPSETSRRISETLRVEFGFDNLKEKNGLSAGENYGEFFLNGKKREIATLENEKNYLTDLNDKNILTDSSASESGSENNAENTLENITVAGELPKLLEIPKLGISAKIQYIGLNSGGEMDTPSNNKDVGWYNLGPLPGEIGSAVIAGHLDTKSGKPAVFWNLQNIKIGDYLFVTDNNSKKKRFRVVSIKRYETGGAPIEKIFGASDGAYLNLVTCGGVWDRAKNNYTERFVVFAEYVFP